MLDFVRHYYGSILVVNLSACLPSDQRKLGGWGGGGRGGGVPYTDMVTGTYHVSCRSCPSMHALTQT